MDKQSSTEDGKNNRPSPADFDVYLPWACKQLQMEATVQVTKIYQNEYVSVAATERSKKGKSKGKITQSRIEVASDQDKDEKSVSAFQMQTYSRKVVRIHAIYDNCDNLVQVKFDKNNNIPRVMIKIIGLIVQFQIYLNNITINGGLDEYTIYEICKFINTSHITDICLDDCYLKEPNYHLLLEKANHLRQLSLCRCKIGDDTVEAMSSKLVYPWPASKSLFILNLSSNRITDEGVRFLAYALRSNRQLTYLNLASNMITDTGANAIFQSLIEFPLNNDDVRSSRERHMAFLKNKTEMIAKTITELKIGEADKRMAKRKNARPASATMKKGKLDKDMSLKSLAEPNFKSVADMDSHFLDKAIFIVENTLGEFTDPFSSANTVTRNGVTYCKGNNCLCYLNISYNSLSYLSLQKLNAVLVYQKLLDRKPRGLVNVSVEGNYMPIRCKKLSQIDDNLEIALIAVTRRLSANKKRSQAKTTPRRFDI